MNDPAQIVSDPKIAAAIRAAAIKDLDELTKKPAEKMVDVVEEVEEEQEDWQAAYNVGGHFKEQLEAIVSQWRKDPEVQSGRERPIKEMEEIPKQPELGKEVESYVERVEKDPELAKALTDDYVRQVGMTGANPQNPKVTLPLTDDQIKSGLHHKVWEAIRWLAEWCVRQIKVINGRS